ncbi:hypothetical protein GCL60_03330 [Silvanigrella paludirubra]|uniref:Uncharacterized protein n=1 Tax=Silvanigrella paludirubra TaxID=2499159 RepID=A0A6N6VY37_9BACT|nr:hypothetical protein [Silvanigrella paludirubra]KAB8040979.1 hypothetical protein GCL60_03330 [Silvanigrella paludirubra]
MNNIFFDFIIDYAKHKKSPFDSEYEILIFELQALCGSDLSNKPNSYYKKKEDKSLFKNFLSKHFKIKSKNEKYINDTTAISNLFGSKSALRGVDEYTGEIEYRDYINNMDPYQIEKLMKEKPPEYHTNNIDYLSQNKIMGSFLRFFNVKGKISSNKLILNILDNKIAQRLILNSNSTTREFIPKCFIFQLDSIKKTEDRIKVMDELLTHFNTEDDIIFKIDECLGKGNFFTSLKRLRAAKQILNGSEYSRLAISFFQNEYFSKYSGNMSQLVLVEAISNLASISRDPSKNSANVYRAALVYHKENNKVILFNAINIHLDKTDKTEADSHKWNTSQHFALKEPRILNRFAKKGASYKDDGETSDYKYEILPLDPEKAKRNTNLLEYKKDLYYKFFKIANILGEYKTEEFMEKLCQDFVQTNKMGKIYISNIDGKYINLIDILERFYSFDDTLPR